MDVVFFPVEDITRFSLYICKVSLNYEYSLRHKPAGMITGSLVSFAVVSSDFESCSSTFCFRGRQVRHFKLQSFSIPENCFILCIILCCWHDYQFILR